MNDIRHCGNADAFVSYLYGELDDAGRRAFEAHLAACETCAGEIEGLRSVRTTLAGWDPPETILGFQVVRDPAPVAARRSRWSWLQMPAWAQLAAASLVIGIATGLSGIEVRYDAGGLVVRTGWNKTPAPVAAQATPARSTAATPWKTDLAALEQQLRREFHQPVSLSQPASTGSQVARVALTGGSRMSDDEFLRRVRSLIEASEQRQQRELALRLTEVVRDMETQRRADLTRVANGMGVIEGRTGAAVAQQREVLNYLMRVSQRQDPPR